MSAPTVAAGLLALAVTAAWVRLFLWQRGSGALQSRWWRIALLAVLQPTVAASLYLAFFSPTGDAQGGTLVVATEGAPRLIGKSPGESLVAMPEARGVVGAVRSPDLGTALRQHPGAGAIRVIGSGLVARDRPAAAQVSLRYDPPAPSLGVTGLTPPSPVAPGEAFPVAARVTSGGTVELRDPAGRLVDTAKPDGDGMVTLTGTARVPSEALFTLRHVNAGASETVRVPVLTVSPAATRVLILAGAPGPEVKFLRRWAADAGLVSQVQLAAGGGLTLGDAPVAITTSTLARYDAAILDDRAWSSLGGEGRAAIARAVRGGMGVVVRITGPVPRGWQVLGLAAGAGSAITPLRLAPAAPNDAALSARRGTGSRDAPAMLAAPLGEVPELSRQAVALGGGGTIPLLRDRAGVVFAAWRQVGRGRVGVITVLDSFALATSGNGDAHADLWSRVVSTVGRGKPAAAIEVAPLARAGERVVICGAQRTARVISADGRATALLADPSRRGAGCAGFWPVTPGWHRITGSTAAFYVNPANALPNARTAERREATLALVGEGPSRHGGASPTPPQPSWSWLLVAVAAAALLWWLERARTGRGRTPAPS